MGLKIVIAGRENAHSCFPTLFCSVIGDFWLLGDLFVHKYFNLGHNLWTDGDKTFIFNLYDIPFVFCHLYLLLDIPGHSSSHCVIRWNCEYFTFYDSPYLIWHHFFISWLKIYDNIRYIPVHIAWFGETVWIFHNLTITTSKCIWFWMTRQPHPSSTDIGLSFRGHTDIILSCNPAIP
jgi:hypothetical protein